MTKTVYVSLVRDFLGCYIKVELETLQFKDEDQLRKHLNEHYRKWWCSVYDNLEIASEYDPKKPTVYTFDEFDKILKNAEEKTNAA